jgi:hypothetical protein
VGFKDADKLMEQHLSAMKFRLKMSHSLLNCSRALGMIAYLTLLVEVPKQSHAILG